MSADCSEQMMVDTVFNRQNLEFLTKGFNCLVETWMEVAQPPDETITVEQVIGKLERVTRDEWTKIEEIFLKDPYHGFSQKRLEGNELLPPASLILDLISVTTLTNQNITTSLKHYKEKTAGLQLHITALQDEIIRLKEQVIDVRWQESQSRSQLQGKDSAIGRLEALNKDKTQAISQLQRDGTIQLWQLEKKKAIDQAKIREEEFSKRVAELEKERVKLLERTNDMEEKMKMEKLKNELQLKADPQEAANELEKYKKQCFRMEKDLLRLDRELNTFQKITIGLFHGLKFDFETTFAEYKTTSKMTNENTIFQILRLEKLLAKFHQASAMGAVSLLPSELPDRYIGTDRDVLSPPVKLLSAPYTIDTKLTPLPKRTYNLPTNEDTGSDDDDDESSDDEVKRVLRKRNMNKKPAKENLPRRDSVKPNIQLVDPNNDQVDMIAVMKNFPHMSKDYVLEQWHQFRRFDTDQSLTLDLSEMINAMMKTVGQQFTAPEIREAMLEVDMDGSDDIDFFEYITVANMLSQKSGNSAVFRSNIVQQQGNSVSKTCAVM